MLNIGQLFGRTPVLSAPLSWPRSPAEGHKSKPHQRRYKVQVIESISQVKLLKKISLNSVIEFERRFFLGLHVFKFWQLTLQKREYNLKSIRPHFRQTFMFYFRLYFFWVLFFFIVRLLFWGLCPSWHPSIDRSAGQLACQPSISVSVTRLSRSTKQRGADGERARSDQYIVVVVTLIAFRAQLVSEHLSA